MLLYLKLSSSDGWSLSSSVSECWRTKYNVRENMLRICGDIINFSVVVCIEFDDKDFIMV